MQLQKIIPVLIISFALIACNAQQQIVEESVKDPYTVTLESLEAKLSAQRKKSAKTISAEVKNTFKQAIKDLEESGIVEKALKKGDKAPNFTLPDAMGDEVELKELLKKGPVVISFYRGGWCPYCNLELAALKEALPEIHKYGAELVAVSPEKPDKSKETIEKMNLHFKVLSDKASKVAEYFGIAFKVPDDVNEHYKDFGINLKDSNVAGDKMLPIPATYVVDQDQVIRFAFVDPDYTKRAEPKDVIEVLSELNKSSDEEKQ